MNKKTLKKQLKKVKAFENLLMRELTDAETECLLEKGDEAMLEMLGWTEEELKTFEDIKRLIMLYCTEDVETFDEYVHSNDLSLAYFVLKTICNELESIEREKHYKTEKNCDENELCTAPCMQNPETVSGCAKSDAVEDTEPFTLNRSLEVMFQDFFEKQEFSKTPKTKKLVPRITDYIAALEAGKELTLDTKTINEIEEYLWDHYDNVVIKVKDNKISAKF